MFQNIKSAMFFGLSLLHVEIKCDMRVALPVGIKTALKALPFRVTSCIPRTQSMYTDF